jgi:hypothetical protein
MTEPHHFLNLPGARVVATEQLLDTRDLIADLVEVRAMGAVYGPAGTGKTFAVAQALTARPPSAPGFAPPFAAARRSASCAGSSTRHSVSG